MRARRPTRFKTPTHTSLIRWHPLSHRHTLSPATRHDLCSPNSSTLEQRMNIRRLVANLLELSTMLVSLSHPSKSDASDELALLVCALIFQAVDRQTARPVPTLSLTLRGPVVIEYGAEVDTQPISLRLVLSGPLHPFSSPRQYLCKGIIPVSNRLRVFKHLGRSSLSRRSVEGSCELL